MINIYIFLIIFLIICLIIFCVNKYKLMIKTSNINSNNSKVSIPIIILPNNQILIDISNNNKYFKPIKPSQVNCSNNIIFPLDKQITQQINNK